MEHAEAAGPDTHPYQVLQGEVGLESLIKLGMKYQNQWMEGLFSTIRYAHSIVVVFEEVCHQPFGLGVAFQSPEEIHHILVA